MGGYLMSLEDDILQSQQELLAKAKAPEPFIGRVVSADPDPLQVVVEGTSVPLPAFSFSNDTLTPGIQVAVLPIGPRYVVLGALGDAVAPTPEVAKTKCNVLAADTNYGTTATELINVALTVGTWRIDITAGWSLVGATDQFSQVTFSGTSSMASFDFMRFTTSANAATHGVGLASEYNMGQTTPQGLIIQGGITVTADGNFGLSFRRNAGTSGTVRAGAAILATMVQ